MIITDLTNVEESDRRLFRKRRLRLMKLINSKRVFLKRVKNGVYLIPFEKPEPSPDEVRVIQVMKELIRFFDAKADYYATTHVTPKKDFEWSEPWDFSDWKNYFILEPIKVNIE